MMWRTLNGSLLCTFCRASVIWIIQLRVSTNVGVTPNEALQTGALLEDVLPRAMISVCAHI